MEVTLFSCENSGIKKYLSMNLSDLENTKDVASLKGDLSQLQVLLCRPNDSVLIQRKSLE